MKLNNINNKREVIAENEKWFKIFAILPEILTIFFAVEAFLAGIIMAIACENGVFLLIFLGGGVIFCPSVYVTLKFELSYKILHIYYLKEVLNYNDNVSKTPEIQDQNELPEI